MLLASDLNAQMLGGLGWRELILMAAIVLLLASANRLMGSSREEGLLWAEHASSRGYLDRLLGLGRRRLVRSARRDRQGRRASPSLPSFAALSDKRSAAGTRESWR